MIFYKISSKDEDKRQGLKNETPYLTESKLSKSVASVSCGTKEVCDKETQTDPELTNGILNEISTQTNDEKETTEKQCETENNPNSKDSYINDEHSFNWHVCSDDSKPSQNYENNGQLYFPCKDMVNYDILKGHKYEIIVNPERDKCKNTRMYICMYDGCGKTFTKTWNLVYHFRVHTKEKPFICDICNTTFSHKCNLSRHLETHSK